MRYLRVIISFLTCRSSPIIYSYLLMAIFAPRLTKFFKPFQLHRLLILHNSVCSALSLYCFLACAVALWQIGNPFSISQTSGLLHHSLFVYWVSKFVELTDTVYMILRHKKRQISFLHVFHHSSVTLLADMAYNLYPWPPCGVAVGLNSGVHIVMYGYYALTAVYPLHAFSWKKRITQLQMAQFLFGVGYGAIGYAYHGFCVYSILYPGVMFLLFSNFYYRAFVTKKGSRKTTEDHFEDGQTKQD